MNTIRNTILIIIFPFLPQNVLAGQSIKILKDSVLIDSTYFVLEEFKIVKKSKEANENIYREVQSSYNILDKKYFNSPEARLRAKKELLLSLVKDSTLNNASYGFEEFSIYYDENNMINFSNSLKVYGSPWQAAKWYCFNLVTGKNIGINLFSNPLAVLKKCRAKLKSVDVKISIKTDDLSSFEFKTDSNKNIVGLDFIFYDYDRYRNSGYEMHVVNFDWKEIKLYVSPAYNKAFKNVRY